MPRPDTTEILLRQWEILQMLPSRGAGITATELTNELNARGKQTDLRNTQRDLNQLRKAFSTIECNDAGKPYGWRWAKNTSSNIPAITLADALSLQLIEGTLRHLLPSSVLKSVEPRLKQAEVRLKNEPKMKGVAPWSDKVYQIDPSMPLLPPSIDSEVLETVHSALMKDWQLEVEYHSMNSNDYEARTLHPLGLVQRGPTSYLIATAYDYKKPLIWAIHRIRKAELLPEKCHRPDEFVLEKYVKSGKLHFGPCTPLTLEAEVTVALARILEETPLSEDQTLSTKDGLHYVTACVLDTWQLRWWIMSQGADIKILSPKSLRKDIAESLKEAYEKYVKVS